MPRAAYILFRNPAEGPRRRIGTHLVEPQDYIISLKFSETVVCLLRAAVGNNAEGW